MNFTNGDNLSKQIWKAFVVLRTKNVAEVMKGVKSEKKQNPV